MWWLREAGDPVAVIITPEPGRHKDIGQLLLSLADHPSHVQWVTWPTAGYSVPEELYALFEQGLQPQAEQKPDAQESAPQAPAKRRGRPRKEASTDNTDSEEE